MAELREEGEEEEEVEAEEVVVVVVVVAAVFDGLFPAVLVRTVDEGKINSLPSLGGSSSETPLPFPLKRSSSAKSKIRLN